MADKTQKQIEEMTKAFAVAFRLAANAKYDCYSEMKHALLRAHGEFNGTVEYQTAAHEIEQVLRKRIGGAPIYT